MHDMHYHFFTTIGLPVVLLGETTGLDQTMKNHHQEGTLTWRDDGTWSEGRVPETRLSPDKESWA